MRLIQLSFDLMLQEMLKRLEKVPSVSESAGYQPYAVAAVVFLGKIPETLTYAQAASTSLTFTTVVYGLLPPHTIDPGLIQLSTTKLPFVEKRLLSLERPLPLVILTIYSAVTSIEAEDAAFACLAKDDKLAVAVTQPKPRDDVETTGRTVYGVFGAPHIPPNKGFSLILRKNLPRLFQQGFFVFQLPNDLPGIVDGLKKDEVGGVKLVVFPLRS
ncbi:hypothetical protein DFJ43DRAFT_373540 [Lentinula guzmanii]|uniref:Uncharacterized protein n=1 Tax=Lentinula guzmanii TaxID=2804957 RepID=A0AA38MZ36_9AGAR|nr:hypothetical protein DFJ43DRAFT_373540 [Lentinula guzmanii]